MPTETFAFTDGTSGQVTKAGGVTTGWANCDIAMNGKPPLVLTETQAFFQFDTSNLPDNATVTMVEFYRKDDTAQPATDTDHYNVYIGNFIGGALDAGDFDGGNSLSLDIKSYGDAVWIDLNDGGVDPTGYVDVTGTTDVAIRAVNDSNKNAGHNFNTSKSKCQLRVTYTVPVGESFDRLRRGIVRR